MDPNATLFEMRTLAKHVSEDQRLAREGGFDQHNGAERLANLVEALDEWMSNAGFLPEDWSAGR